jgi:hypothetical protein
MPADERRSRDLELADLAALADGSLPPERRPEVEARVAASPRLQALLREQQAALRVVRMRQERAPRRLHDAVARLHGSRSAGGSPVRHARRHAGRQRIVLGLGLGLAAAGAAALALLVLPGSEPAPPTLVEAAALAARAATSAEPSGEQSGAVLAGVKAWGLEYPNLSRAKGWRSSGSRTDRVGDRTAKTVFYTKDGRRIAYTILSPGSVRVPRGAAAWHRKGRPWYALDEDGRTVVAWERKGHMCVVSVNGIRRRALVDLITG